MKKHLALFLASAMVFSLSACNGSSTSSVSSASSQQAPQSSAAEASSVTPTPAPKDLETVSLRLNYYVSGLHAPFYLALEKGYYSDLGIDLKIGEGKGSGTTTTLVGNQSDMLGISDMGTTAVAITQGMPVKVVAPIYAINAFAIISGKDSGINSPKDLEGKKIAITEGDAPTKMFSAVAAANDVDVSKIEFISMDANGKTGALMTGKVDALLGGADAQALQLEKEGFEPNVIRYADVGVNTVGLSVVANNADIKNNPELITAFLEATYKGWEEASKDQEGAVAILKKYFPMIDEAQAVKELNVALGSLYTPTSSEMGLVSDSDWEKSVNLLVEYMGLDKNFPYDAFYTNELLPENLPKKG